jgi:GTPase involved in cell partitioning and DNA repair
LPTLLIKSLKIFFESSHGSLHHLNSQDSSKCSHHSQNSMFDKEKHKFFDEATILVRGGQGGDGEAWLSAKAKSVKNFKYKWGRNTKKFIELPAAEPADGGKGGDVYIRVDRNCNSLLRFHECSNFLAKKGYHGSTAAHATPGRERHRVAPPQEDLFVDVPPGTVVRRKRSGVLLGDMTRHGQTLLVAEGGAGGIAARRARLKEQNIIIGSTRTENSRIDSEVYEIELDSRTRNVTVGMEGEEFTLELLMRVVADVGLVGLPNAGKSSILKALTRASPNIASYPFTTLMPNLGVVRAPDASAPETKNYSMETNNSGPILADLPGLIAGAHKGYGLGRVFLRHLRRTRALLVVVDASGQDPVGDFVTVRRELRLYNPDYVMRRHILVLNKIDLEWAALRTEEIISGVMALHESTVGCAPFAIMPVSAEESTGMDSLLAEIDKLLQVDDSGTDVSSTSGTKNAK